MHDDFCTEVQPLVLFPVEFPAVVFSHGGVFLLCLQVLTRQKPLTGQDLSSDQSVIDTTARRFWGARMLVDIVHEIDDETVALTWLPQTSDHARPRVQVVRELRERARKSI